MSKPVRVAAVAGVSLALAALAFVFLVPDWRARLGVAPEGTPEAVSETTETAPATGEEAATGGEPAAPGSMAGTAAEGDKAPSAPGTAESASVAPASDEAAPAATGEAGTAEGAEASPSGTDAAGPSGTGTAAGADPTAEQAAIAPPRFDVVRVDPEGEAVIAGNAAPGAEVEVLLDGAVIATAKAGRDGSFVAIASLGRSNEARALQLRLAGSEAAASALATATAADPAAPAGEAGPAAEGGAPAEVASADAAPGGDANGDDASRADAAGGDAEPSSAGLSEPVIILPTTEAGEAPVIVSAAAGGVDLLQAAPAELRGVVLDRITYSPGGDAVAAGRARAGHAVRVYANAVFVADTTVREDGAWQVSLPKSVAEEAKLLRFDEVAPDGEVASRLETPFAYDDGVGEVVSRNRRITVQRGDNLWRIAEQHYGEGIRYSLIFGANSGLIRDPDLIYPGQIFTVPELIATE